ncbi:MAG TPA: sugar ABC transporter permease [Firmicutes bacterium]|nr:sugar ABC transporter permease [Bacillota bacterium]
MARESRRPARELRQPPARTLTRKPLSEQAFGSILITPAMLAIVGLLFYPMIYAFWMSLNNIDFGTGKFSFAGLQNYIDLFFDPRIIKSFKATLVFSVGVTVITLALSLLLALLLNQNFKGRGLCRALLLIPWAVAPIANGLMWKWMFNPRLGLINNLLISVGVLDHFENWLMKPGPAMIAVIVTMVYKTLPFITLLFLAALQSIPAGLYEAAYIDGAGVFQRFWRITLPLLRPSMVIIKVVLSVNTLKAFDMIYVLTEGGPADATMVANYMAYAQSFKLLRFGYGAALAFVISIVILLMNLAYFKFLYRGVSYE